MISEDKKAEVSSEIMAFVCDESGVDKDNIHLETRLFHDLGIDGIDAYDLLDKYSLKYKVSLGELPHHDYFNEETGISLIAILKRLFGKMHMSNKKPLTIMDLVNGVIMGTLKPDRNEG
ncbi:MAG: DUF1493 family protein [Candidatus Thiodiazotropha endolucinida]